MTSGGEASFLVRQLALPAPAGDTTKAAIFRAHRVLNTWTWNRVRDVWHADPRIKVSADELNQLRELVRARKVGGGSATRDDRLGFMERIAAIEAELRELRALVSRLPSEGIGQLPLGIGREAQERGAAPVCAGEQDGAEQGKVPRRFREATMDGSRLLVFSHGTWGGERRRGNRIER
jgi:hypothetical protein